MWTELLLRSSSTFAAGGCTSFTGRRGIRGMGGLLGLPACNNSSSLAHNLPFHSCGTLLVASLSGAVATGSPADFRGSETSCVADEATAGLLRTERAESVTVAETSVLGWDGLCAIEISRMVDSAEALSPVWSRLFGRIGFIA